MNPVQITVVLILALIGAYLCGYWMACVACEKRLIAETKKLEKQIHDANRKLGDEIISGIQKRVAINIKEINARAIAGLNKEFGA